MSNETRPPLLAEKRPEAQPEVCAVSPREIAIPPRPNRLGRRRQMAMLAVGLLLIWLAAAYLLLPAFWKSRAQRHPSLEDVPRVTHTGSNIPGDPLNVQLIGTEDELSRIMLAAKWHPADALTLRSCLRIARASVFKRPFDTAPVSNLYLWGRKQDLAFQQAVGNNPRQRHHVRFWCSDKIDPDGRPIWIGAAIYDRAVGLSHTTGQITHHTAADIDAERAKLFDDLKRTGDLVEQYIVEGFHKVLQGRNGGGDRWYTDGNLYAGVLKPEAAQSEP